MVLRRGHLSLRCLLSELTSLPTESLAHTLVMLMLSSLMKPQEPSLVFFKDRLKVSQ